MYFYPLYEPNNQVVIIQKWVRNFDTLSYKKMIRSDFYHSYFFCSERETVCYPPPKSPSCEGDFCKNTKVQVCYLSPKPPLTFGLPPSHLGIACKHSLLSVWRRFCKGGLFIYAAKDLGVVLALLFFCSGERPCVTHPGIVIPIYN